MNELSLEVSSRTGSSPLRFAVSEAVLGGYTARSAEIRDAHIAELRELGIEPPDEVPAFWPISPALLTTGGRLWVQGGTTSGEAEFVLWSWAGTIYVGVGSDQTDRELEAYSIPRSKHVCGKVLSSTVVRLDDVREVWDDIVLSCDVRDGDGWHPYQRAALSAVLPPDTLLGSCFGPQGPPHGGVLMSGTIPLLDGVTRYPGQYRVSMAIPTWPEEIACSYVVERLPDSRSRAADAGRSEP